MSDELLALLTERAKRNAVGSGNINLFSRPRTVTPSGDIATLNSVGINEGSGELLVPGVGAHGGLLSPGDSRQQYRDTGQFLGKPQDVPSSNMLGEFLHREAASGLTTPPLATSRQSINPDHLRDVLMYLLRDPQ